MFFGYLEFLFLGLYLCFHGVHSSVSLEEGHKRCKFDDLAFMKITSFDHICLIRLWGIQNSPLELFTLEFENCSQFFLILIVSIEKSDTILNPDPGICQLLFLVF